MKKYLSKVSKILTFLFLVVMVFQNAIIAKADTKDTTNKRDIITYFPNWGVYDASHFSLTPDKLPWDKIDIVNHSFFSIDKSFKLVSIDTYADYEMTLPHSVENGLAGCFGEYKYYAEKYPNTKVMVSVGGWTRGENFHDMAKTAAGRKTFIQSCIDFMNKYPFIAGIDLDWEYPGINRAPEAGDVYDKGCPGGPEDTENYTALIKEMRSQFDAAGMKNKWITICGPAGEDKVQYQQLDIIQNYVNRINLMTYDFHGNWDNETNHLTPFTVNPNDPSPTEPIDIKNNYNTLGAVELYLNKLKIDPAKLSIGTPWYSRGWGGVDASTGENGMFAKTDGTQFKGNWDEAATPSGQESWWSLKKMENTNGWTKYRDEYNGSPWLYNKDKKVVLAYEDEYSMQLKCELIRRLNLSGMIVWEITGDDMSGGFPMTNLLRKELDTNYVYDSTINSNLKLSVDSDSNFGSFTLNTKVDLFSNGTKLDIYEDNKLIDTVSVSDIKGGLIKYDITNKQPGTYNYKVVLKNADKSKESNIISVKVNKADLLAPTIDVDSKLNRGSYTIKATSPANSSGSTLELYEDDKLVDSKALTPTLNKEQSLTFKVDNKANGTYKYKVVVKDKEGNSKEASTNVQVDKKTPIMPSDISVKFQVTSDWGSGGNYRITLTNNSLVNLTNYTLEFKCDKAIQNCWGAGTFKAEGNKYTVTPQSWNTKINAGQTVFLDGSIAGGAQGSDIYDVKITYDYDGQIVVPDDPTLQAPKVSVNNATNLGDYKVTVTVPKNNKGTSVKLYENGALVKEEALTSGATADKVVEFAVTGKKVGSYEYKAVISDGKDSLESSVVKVTVTENGGGTDPVIAAWAPMINYKAGDLVSYSGKTYECRQPHLSLNGWEPTNVPALWSAK